MATLKLTPKYMNSYEAAHKMLSNNPWYNEKDWQSMAKSGDLDMYITALVNTDKIDKDKFYSDYDYEYADDRTRVAALYNELFADRTNSDTVRQRLITDGDGNAIPDANGKPQYEEYTASDYDYRKSIIKNRNSVNYKEFLDNQERERKESMNGFVKVLADIGGVGTSFLYGFADQLDNLTNSFAAIGNAASAIFNEENPFDAIVETNASDQWRFFENAGVQDMLVDFEKRYTHFRDPDGNHTNVGKWIGGVATSIGQLAPSFLAGKLSGGLSQAAGASVETAGKVSQVTSSLVFYQAMTAGNVRDAYKQLAEKGASVPSLAILGNAALKSALQWAIEVGLGKILGGTAIDSVVFGRAVNTVASKTLAAAAGKRIFHDFVSEGLEEVFQDTSDWLVNKAFGVLIDENFGKLQNISFQSLVDAFYIGGLASFAGSAVNIVTTKRVSTGQLKKDKDGNVIYDENGAAVAKKLGQLASWEYGLDMQSFVKNYMDIQEMGKGLITQYGKGSKEVKQWSTAFTEMYAAYRMISSIYGEIGEERFKNANAVLSRVTELINEGKFNSRHASVFAETLNNELSYMKSESLKLALDELEKANITQLANVVERGDDLESVNINPEAKKALLDLLNGDKEVEKVILTKDGSNVVAVDNTIFVPINYANNADGSTIYSTIAEQTLVKSIVRGKFKGMVLDKVLSTFKTVSGKENATMEEAVYNLVFNQSFFNIMLSTANKDMYDLLSSLISIEQSVVSDRLRSKIYKNKIATVVENMKSTLYNYCIVQANADFRLDLFTAEQIRKIKAARWCKNLYSRVINDATYKKLSDADWEVLNSRVNSLPVKQDEKDRILKGLKSGNKDSRTSAMNRIASAYKGIFTTNYDGNIYMPDNSIANRTFNSWLQSSGLTIETLTSTDVEAELKNSVETVYGEFNQDTLTKFRQDQFMKSCNGSFTFAYDAKGKVAIYEKKTDEQVGFSEYKAEIQAVLEGKNLNDRTNIERSFKKNYLVKQIANEKLDNATSAYLSIDDVITDTSLLSNEIRAQIQMKYGTVSSMSAFLYLREYFINKLKTTTVVVLSDGSYAFADVRPMKSLLKTENFEITKKTKISDIIKDTYLQGRLKDVKIKLTDKSIVAEYHAAENVIYINSEYAARKGDYLTFAILHEFQHAIQVENGMNLGINADWIKSASISKTTKKEIIASVRKHRPELFQGVVKGSDQEAKIVNDFVYYSSGESTAYGIDASKLVNFYPTIVNDSPSGTKVRLPWGSSYNLTNKMPMSFASTFDLFNIDELTNEQVSLLKAYAVESFSVFEGNINSYLLSEQEIENFSKTGLFKQLSNLSGDNLMDFYTTFITIFENTKEIKDKLKYAEQMYTYFNKIAQCCYKLLPDGKGGRLESDLLYVSDMFLTGSELRIKLDTLNTKSYSPSELIKEYHDKYRQNFSDRVKTFSDVVFNKFNEISKYIICDIKTVAWMYEYYHGYPIRQIGSTVGFSIGNAIRYHSHSIDASKDFEHNIFEVYPHEISHFIFTPFVRSFAEGKKFKNSRLHSLINFAFTIYEQLENTKFFDTLSDQRAQYPMSRIDEFFVSPTNEKFLTVLEQNNLVNEATRIVAKMLIGNFSNDADLLTKLFSEIVNEINIYDEFHTYKNYHKYVENTPDFKRTMYPESHEGRAAVIDYDKDSGRFYRLDEFTEEIIYEGDINYFSTSLGSYDLKTMSAKKPGESFGEGSNQKPKRYVSQREAKGTNLEKYGYTAKYKRTQLSQELKNFIVAADSSIDEVLWKKLISGKLTTSDVMDFLRDSEVIDDRTFKLINDSFFKNDKIKTFDELKKAIEMSPKYYAMRAVLRSVLKSEDAADALLNSTNRDLYEQALRVIEQDEKLKKLFSEIAIRYDTLKWSPIVISEKYLRKLWMEHFTGSINSAGYIASVAKIAAILKWKVTGEGDTLVRKSLDDKIDEERSIMEKIEDKSATAAFQFIIDSASREDRIQEIIMAITPKLTKKLRELGPVKAQKYLHHKHEQLSELSDREFAKVYQKYVKGMSEEEINRQFIKTLVVESGGIDISTLDGNQLDTLEMSVNNIVKKTVRPSSAVVNNMKSIVRTIKNNLSKNDRTLFLKDNSDLFDEDLNLKKDLYQTKNSLGLTRLKDVSELLELENRLKQLSKSVRANDYSSAQSLRFRKRMEKELEKLRADYEKALAKVGTKQMQAVTYEVADDVITIDTNKEIPLALKRILENEFRKVAKSETKYLAEENEKHVKMNLKSFMRDNAEYLAALTQSDVDEIIDFYTTSEILPSTNKARQYIATQLYLTAYMLNNAKSGRFLLSEEQNSFLKERIKMMTSTSAAITAAWKSVLPYFKPEEELIQSLANSNGIEFAAADVQELVEATASGDITRIQAAKTRMYNNALNSHKGVKKAFLDRLLKFERMAMLSGPGTWIRNKASNLMVTGGNRLAEGVSGPIVKMLEKIFPKTFKHRDKQYKIVGTKVTSEVKTFIKNQIIDSGMLALIRDGLNKYDTRKYKISSDDAEQSIADLIQNAIRSRITQDTFSESKVVNETYAFLYRRLSDDRSIEKAMIRYLGKTLTEDKVDLTQGISNVDVLNHVADAYVMAAQEFMHKGNFFNDIENKLRERLGNKAFFVYKQFFPFAAASWNWFMEGLNYTPIGLVKGIIQYAKLENTINSLDDKRQKGQQVISSRFAEYVAKKNIGKGVLGTIGLFIGMALAAFGVAGIDEEDGKYKIHVGDVYVDISDLFGSQGILLGIVLISGIKNKDGDVWDMIGNILDAIYLDSTFTDLFNSFRYSNTFGDWLRDQPFDILSMFIPNLLKSVVSLTYGHKVQYSKGLRGKLEKLGVQAIPGLAYAMPKKYDPYTGENQIQYKWWFLTQFVNKLSPLDIAVYNVSEQEKIAISLGLRKGQLTGNYEIDGEKVNLTSKQVDELNKFYGKLNEKELKAFISGSVKYRILDEKTGKYVELSYGKMTDKQKATVIDRIMSNNGSKAKIYVLTKYGKYNYYASSEEYKELKALGIKVFKSTDSKKGFSKN